MYEPNEDLELGELDLISMLTPQSHWGLYERQIKDIPWVDGFELPSLESVKAIEKEQEKALGIKKSRGTTADAPKDKAKSEKEELMALAAKLGPITDEISALRAKVTAINSDDNFEQLEEDIKACKDCDLCNVRSHIVMGAGSKTAKLMFIGQSPRDLEEKANSPIAGEALEHFHKILKAAGFDPEEIYICNLIKCKTPNGRPPSAEEISACSNFLNRQISLIKPKLIGCLGTLATQAVIGPRTPSINRVHGRWFDTSFQIPATPLFHPIQLAQDSSRAPGSPNWAMWQDMQALKKKYHSL